jgi:hypothetical protein
VDVFRFNSDGKIVEHWGHSSAGPGAISQYKYYVLTKRPATPVAFLGISQVQDDPEPFPVAGLPPFLHHPRLSDLIAWVADVAGSIPRHGERRLRKAPRKSPPFPSLEKSFTSRPNAKLSQRLNSPAFPTASTANPGPPSVVPRALNTHSRTSWVIVSPSFIIQPRPPAAVWTLTTTGSGKAATLAESS